MTTENSLLLEIDRNRPTPVYRQIEDQLREKIRTGVLSPGDCLPNGQELSRQSGVAYRTIIRSLTTLKKEGLLRGVPSRGTFVQESPSRLQDIAITFNRHYQKDVVRDVERFQRGIMAASEGKFDLQLFPLRNATIYDASEPTLLSRLIEERHIHGVVTFNAPPLSDIRRLREMNIPVVTSRDMFPDTDVPWVMEDVSEGASKLVQFLTALGHRSFGLVMGSKFDPAAGVVRPSSLLAKALSDRLTELSLPCPEERLVYTNFDWPVAESAVRRWLSAPDRPTALILVNDHFAMRIIQVARELGLSVPRDLSIASYGDLLHEPSTLTTIHLPIEQMAEQAVDYLIQLANGIRPVPKTLPVELMIRQTCGQAPAVKS